MLGKLANRQLRWRIEPGGVIAVCYIPPEASGSGRNAERKVQFLLEQVEKYTPLDPLQVCGDF